MNNLAQKYLRQEALPLIFCPGCGDGIVLNCFIRAIDALGIRDDLGLVSGIGCSSWIPVYIDVDVVHCLHGRAVPLAEGLKMARPDKHVVVFSGDGDCFGIGGNHIIHAARRNIDITVIMINNYIYGMTGGQRAPTTPFEAITKTSPLGNDERPFDILSMMTGAGATYYARWTTAHPVQLEKAFECAITHKGLSFVEVMSPCPTQAGRTIFGIRSAVELMAWYKNNTYIMRKGAAPDPSEKRIPLGLLYQREDEIEYTKAVAQKRSVRI